MTPWLGAARVLAAAILAGCARVGSGQAAPIIAIDPGHPSEVSAGTERQNGTTEVHEAWMVAQELARLLRERGYEVVMTKQREDEMVRNVARAEVGNRSHAQLMIRLHLDASVDSGYAVYYPDRVGTAEGRTGPSAEVMRWSRAAADSVHAAMAPLLRGRLKDGGVRGDSRTLVGSRQGALTGSIFSEVPVVLVEMATLSNPRDAAFISSANGRALMARALADGVSLYVPRRKP